MDLVQLSELISTSPYSLPVVLIIILWWAADAIKRKDNDIKESNLLMKAHYDSDAAKSEKRETFFHQLIGWFQWFIETDQSVKNPKSIKKVEPILMEGRENFEPDDGDGEIPPSTTDDGGDLTRIRSKLSGRKAK